MKRLFLLALVLVVAGVPAYAAEDAPRRPPASLASLAPPAAAGPLRILLVDDDHSDNNHYPGDKRLSQSDRIFRQLVADAVGGDAGLWAVETVKPYASGPSVERLRKYSLVLWYTGANYGGNPDNSAVLSIEDEKTVRRYLEEVGGAFILVSPGYVSKVLGADGSWEKSTWPFLSEVLGIRGGHGLAQRFESGTVNASGAQFTVGKGSAVESQFSTVNPNGAAVVFTAAVGAGKKTGKPSPVATAFPYGRGRMVYVGFTFENLAEPDLAPAFRHLITATGLVSPTLSAGVRPAARPKAPPASAVSSPEAEPASVLITGTPVSAVVSWTLQSATVQSAKLGGSQHVAGSAAKPAATAYTPTVKVERLAPNAAPVRLTIASPDALKADDPGPLTPGRALTYRVTLTDTKGRTGIKEASFTPPPARDPESLSASVQADGSVVLSWPEVPGVTSYQVKADDRAIAPAIVRRATVWRSAPLDKRKRRWTVNSVYEPGGSLTAPASWPSAESRFVPVPGAPFLSKPAGVGGPNDAQRHYISYQCGNITLQECSAENLLLANRTWHTGTWGRFPDPNPNTSKGDGAVRTYPTPGFYSVAFADLNDLGRGRRVGCTIEEWSSDLTVFCWATSHGPVPAAGASVDGPALALAAERYVDRNNITFNTIHISRRGALFGAWTPPTPPWPASHVSHGPTPYLRHFNAPWWGSSKNDLAPPWLVSRNWDVANREPWQREAIVAAVARPSLATGLDSQGPKSVPHACLSCHGGRYDVSTGWVQGASLLPLIPADLTFSSSAIRAKTGAPHSWPDSYQNSEEALRKINEIIYRSNPSSTIKQRIATLYGGTAAAPAGAPGTRANDLAVPPGWSTQPGLYRQVIAPYCGSCHFAQSGALSFGSYAAVLQLKQAIQRTVCTDFTMPHSEILFRKFWTEGGSVSLPGLLSTALGFPKCLQ